jgi:hypothetical protein
MKSKKSLLKRMLFVVSNPLIYWRLLLYHLNVIWERAIGVDFSRIEQAPDLNFQDNRLNGYWSSANGFLVNVMRSIEVKPSDKILDVGCGKGAALKLFKNAGFGVVDGLEYTMRLSLIARRNMDKLNMNCRVFNCDARLFSNYHDYNFFYFYNPFTGEIMREVIDKIESTLISHPRNVTIIYKNAVCDEMITSNGIFMKKAEIENQKNEKPFVLYINHLK